MSDFTIACNEETNPFYYIVRPNTRDAKQIFNKHLYVNKNIGGSFQSIGNELYAMEQKNMVEFMGEIKTHSLKINFLKILNQGENNDQKR